jgi:hypothetical protein
VATTVGQPATTTIRTSSGGQDTDDRAPIVRSLTADQKREIALTLAQAECVAPKWLATIAVERLEAAKISPAMTGDGVDDDGSSLTDLKLTDAEAGALDDAFGACEVDVHASACPAVAVASNNAGQVAIAATRPPTK